MSKIELIQGDCLEKMKEIPDGSVDMVLTDPPYGTTACKWDSVIPLEPMWEQLKRVIKPNRAIVMTASQPFTTTLIASNMKMFKYCWVWESNKAANFAQAPYMPLKNTEDVIVFSFGGCAHPAKNRMIYNPQGVVPVNKTCKQKTVGKYKHKGGMPTSDTYIQKGTNYPRQILRFDKESKATHPTQKPVALMEYLIKTYTNEDETVLDFTMGSGTTGVACVNLNRNFIGIELDAGYFAIAKQRIETAQTTLKQMELM